MPKSDMVQSLLRALDILEVVATAEDGVGLNDVCAKLCLKKSTAHNLARTLLARGYVVKDGMNRYRSGSALEEMHRLRCRSGIFVRAEAVVRRLYDTLNRSATITFSELVGSEICCRLRISPDTSGSVRRPESQTFSAFGSASGLCLQAFNSDFREKLAEPGLFEESGQRRWKTCVEFKKALDETLRDGVAKINMESGCVLAAPVSNNFVVGVKMVAPAYDEADISASLIDATTEIAGKK